MNRLNQFKKALMILIICFMPLIKGIAAEEPSLCFQAYQRCMLAKGWTLSGSNECFGGYLWCVLYINK